MADGWYLESQDNLLLQRDYVLMHINVEKKSVRWGGTQKRLKSKTKYEKNTGEGW